MASANTFDDARAAYCEDIKDLKDIINRISSMAQEACNEIRSIATIAKLSSMAPKSDKTEYYEEELVQILATTSSIAMRLFEGVTEQAAAAESLGALESQDA